MKLKQLLKETKVWERKFGEPLPVLELKFGSQAQYDKYKKNHKIKDGTKIEVDGKKMTHKSSLPKGSKAANKKADMFATNLNKKMDAAEKEMERKAKEQAFKDMENESVNENILIKQLSKMINEPGSSINKYIKQQGLHNADLLDFVEKLTRNSSSKRKKHIKILKLALKGDNKAEKFIMKTLYGESVNEQGILSKRAGIDVFGGKQLQLMAKNLRQTAFDLEKVAKKKDERNFDHILQRITITVGVMRSFLNKPKRRM